MHWLAARRFSIVSDLTPKFEETGDCRAVLVLQPSPRLAAEIWKLKCLMKSSDDDRPIRGALAATNQTAPILVPGRRWCRAGHSAVRGRARRPGQRLVD